MPNLDAENFPYISASKGIPTVKAIGKLERRYLLRRN
jgi:hypothetical protein